jgi:mannosyltransferase OCH1-like enzyme
LIPKKLHFIWVGDETKRPDNCIQTWVNKNPAYEVKVWGNSTLSDFEWINAKHMDAMLDRELNGVADMMRWEILYREGGVVLDADSICLKPLEDWMMEFEAFACWESEIARPGLIAAGYFGCAEKNGFVGQIINDIKAEPSVIKEMAWKTVGPQRLTDAYRRYNYQELHIFPSHYFIPEHFSGVKYKGPGPVFASQEWASTKGGYDTLHTKIFDELAGVLVDDNLLKPSSVKKTAAQNGSIHLRGDRPLVEELGRSKLVESALAHKHDPYFVQRSHVSRELIGRSRIDVFKSLCENRRVLHVGCADWPITDPNTSLHIALEPFCKELDGFDIHVEALAALAPYTKGELFSRFEDVGKSYDLILVPEVLEHVPNVANFLEQLNVLESPHVVLTVPDAFQCHSRHFEYISTNEEFVEVVHPDHNCWYTPYTLSSTIKKYTTWNIEGIWFFNNISLLTVLTKTPA